MRGWTRHHGTAIALDLENVDTDQLIPARFMSTPREQGYGDFLLHDMRVTGAGTLVPGFPLNRFPGASLLVARRNFGSGSSREAAVYALVDFGIRAVIAPSFGDIFAANAVNNGLLPAQIPAAQVDALIARMAGAPAEAEIDLGAGRVTVADRRMEIALDPVWREKLMNGWDDVDLTRRHDADIAAFRDRHASIHPWAFPEGESAGGPCA